MYQINLTLKKILPFFSYLFHPIFIPILGTLFYIFFNQNYYSREQYFLLLFQVIIITFLLPLTFFYLLRTFGKVDTIMLTETSQRKIPLIVQICLTAVLIQKSVTIDRFPELFFFFLGGIISTFIALIFVFANIKASIHMIALSALTFFVIALSIHHQENCIAIIAILFLISGLVATSRLYMKAHTLIELMLGYIFGMLPQLVLWWFWL